MFSQTTEYALRAMSSLAYTPDELVSTVQLASMTSVPINYLAKVLQQLARADLVTGRRGVGGGYRLKRPASEITMLDVINAINPIQRIGSCPLGLGNHSGGLCPLHARLDRAAQSMIEEFSGVSLHDMLWENRSAHPLCNTQRAGGVELTLGKSG